MTKRPQVADFHIHLNSINEHIQFTIEHPTEIEERQSISFLDCKIAAKPGHPVEITAYRKETHTIKYLDFNLHNPPQHKAAVVNTLLHRAREIPSNEKLQKQEVEKVCTDLEVNGYNRKFIQKVQKKCQRTTTTEKEPERFAVLLYVQGVSGRIKRTLSRVNIKVAFKPSIPLSSVFKIPKDKKDELKTPGIVYKVISAKIATSHMWGRAKDRGIPEAKSTIQDDGLTMNRLSNSIGKKRVITYTPNMFKF